MKKLAESPTFAAARTQQVRKQTAARALTDARARVKPFDQMTQAEKDAALKALLLRFGLAT